MNGHSANGTTNTMSTDNTKSITVDNILPLLYQPIPVDTYSIYIGSDILQHLPQHITKLVPSNKYILITDDNLLNSYAKTIQHAFQQLHIQLYVYSIAPGEHSKSRATKAAIEDYMLAQQCGRDTCMLALGGGVVGDLTGYIAATYMRGIPVIQIPTSLLAMVDSSIGGKTGIDTLNGKNLLGAFHRPKSVYIDLTLLQTLPERQLCNGMAEAIKAGAIASTSLFDLIENNADNVFKRDVALLGSIVQQSAQIKATVVLQDERESGMRSILNFGHSIGHAIEAYCQPELLHGECVGIGMIEEAILARQLGYLNSNAAIQRIDNCLKLYNLPTSVPHKFNLSIQGLLDKMAVDKKNKAGKKEIVMLTSIGTIRANPYTTQISDAMLLRLFHPSTTVIPHIANGTVSVPGSKSLSNRVLLLAALGQGQCNIRGLLHSNDTQVMLDSLRELGVQYTWSADQLILTIQGTAGVLTLPNKPLYLNNAGTASRFLTSVAALVPHGSVVLTGNARMQQRPIKDLVDALSNAGIHIEYLNTHGCLPIRVSGGGVKGDTIELKANVSSQYVSSIMQAATYAQSPTTLKLIGDCVSKPFIDMTVNLMHHTFGIDIKQINESPLTYTIQNAVYNNPADVLVEGDASSASYPLALAAVTGGTVTVNNVGSKSLQGDSKFCTLLQQMGCTVKQTDTTTTVTGTNKLNALNTVDMDSMTDCFMTLAAVAVFATGTTQIINIANQRVKECDRIAATVAGLQAIGVQARELETGIEIVGCGNDVTKLHGATIKCFDDHRLAMSFSVVGSRVSNIVLDEKRCVDKTYPEFYDHIEKLGIVSQAPHNAIQDTVHIQHTVTQHTYIPNQSIVIIGMRGSGKTTTGQYLAQSIGYQFIDVDHVIQEQVGDIKQYVTQNGWDKFRAIELQVFQQLLQQHTTNTVISCGGGIVEIDQARTLLQQHINVILLNRHIVDILAYLNNDSARPSFDPVEAYQRRLPHYKQCSTYEYTINKGDSNWPQIQQNFVRFVQTTILRTNNTLLGEGTFFVALTCPDVAAITHQLPEIPTGVDAVELRVDLLAQHTTEYITQQITLLRQYTTLPIIYTVRSQREGGKFENNETAIFTLLQHGIRVGCEYIDVECSWSESAITSLIQHKQHSIVIGSIHTPSNNGGTVNDIQALLIAASLHGKADVVKVVINAYSTQDAIRLMYAANESTVKQPKIVLAMSEHGKIARVMNSVMSPVTHSLLGTVAAPGQMTVQQIQNTRQQLGLLQQQQYYLFGSPITHSPSPLLHNTGFQTLLLPYTYSKCDISDIAQVKQVISQPTFYGASVTIPLKEHIAPLLDVCTDAVVQIGAVNTIIKRDNKLYGDNTDWLGIYTLLQRQQCQQQNDIAIVLGAGGTARAALYALTKLGYSGKQLIVHNPRTTDKAHTLAKQFNATGIDTLSYNALLQTTQQSNINIRIILSTLPGSVQYQPPTDLFTQSIKPVVFDASYIPYNTTVTQVAQQHQCTTIHGIDLLIAQGLEQFKLWTGRTAAFDVMTQTVRQQYKQQQQQT